MSQPLRPSPVPWSAWGREPERWLCSFAHAGPPGPAPPPERLSQPRGHLEDGSWVGGQAPALGTSRAPRSGHQTKAVEAGRVHQLQNCHRELPGKTTGPAALGSAPRAIPSVAPSARDCQGLGVSERSPAWCQERGPSPQSFLQTGGWASRLVTKWEGEQGSSSNSHLVFERRLCPFAMPPPTPRRPGPRCPPPHSPSLDSGHSCSSKTLRNKHISRDGPQTVLSPRTVIPAFSVLFFLNLSGSLQA